MTKLRLLTAGLAGPAAAAAVLAQTPPAAAPIPNAFALPPSQSVPYNGAPTPPYAPVPPVGSPVGTGAYPPQPTAPTLWSFLGVSRAQREYRQRAAADTPFGELRSRIREPLSKASGGLIPPIPPDFPSLAELQDPGAVGAAAKVKLDRAAAKKRIKAVQYLGTVDCHYWPEAEDALVAGLRADRNEWVRLAAAQTLLKGCCCTKKTILALTMAATCSNADGNPAEKSPRVVAAAQAALSKCLETTCGPLVLADAVAEPAPPVEPKTEERQGERASSKPGPAGAEKGSGGLPAEQVATPTSKEIYERAAARPWGELIAFARAHLGKAPPVPVEYLSAALEELDAGGDDDGTPVAAPAPAAPKRERPANLYDALFADTNTPKSPAPRPQPATPVLAQAAPPPPAAVPARVAAAPAPEAPPAAPAPTVTVAHTPEPPAPVVVRKVEPGRAAVSVPARPAAAPAVRQTGLSVPAGANGSAAGRFLTAANGRDGKAVAAAADALTPTDVVPAGPVPTALLKAAEEQADPAARTACVKALARCKARTFAVLAGLERLSGDRSVDVRVEAAMALRELKGK